MMVGLVIGACGDDDSGSCDVCVCVCGDDRGSVNMSVW